MEPVNRVAEYFRKQESAEAHPASDRIWLRFELLLTASEADLPSAICEVVSRLYALGSTAPAERATLCDSFTFNCFDAAAFSDSPQDAEFVGNDLESRRVLCVAAVFYAVGWDSLSPHAQLWCRRLLTCSVRPDLPTRSVANLLLARTFIGLMVAPRIMGKHASLQEPDASGPLRGF